MDAPRSRQASAHRLRRPHPDALRDARLCALYRRTFSRDEGNRRRQRWPVFVFARSGCARISRLNWISLQWCSTRAGKCSGNKSNCRSNYANGIDIFHATANRGLPYRRACKYVVTCHDIIDRLPEYCAGRTLAWTVAKEICGFCLPPLAPTSTSPFPIFRSRIFAASSVCPESRGRDL